MKHKFTLGGLLVLALLLGLLVLALFLHLGSTAPTRSTWYVDGINGSNNNDCKSPQMACKTIGHTISLASSGDTIMVAAATYYENLTIFNSLTITGAGAKTTIIDGGKKRSVVHIYVGGDSVALSGVTIQNGWDPSIGGGIRVFYPGTLTISNSILSGNSATYGGGISNSGTLTITNSTFSGNTAGGGGGISNTDSGTLTITNSTFSGNTATSGGPGGGGISNDGTLTVSNSTLSGNSATSGSGGGISNSGTLTITNSTFSGNTAGDTGGGIINDGTLTISNSTLSGNSATLSGGGIFNYGTLTISNSTLSGNSATRSGGGIESSLTFSNAGTVTVTNSTLSGNSATRSGGGISIDGSAVTLQNTIVANSPSGGNCYINSEAIILNGHNLNRGAITSNGYNLSSDGTCPFHNTGDLNNTPPMLGPLQNNGGPTQTHVLLAGSPAIDAGNPKGCTGSNGKLLTTDQRGAPRPDPEDLGVGCDMGAFEVQKAP